MTDHKQERHGGRTMSTRSIILITDGKSVLHDYYHHCDGYLAGVGNELKTFIHTAECIVSSEKEITMPGYSLRDMISVLDWCLESLGYGQYELQDKVSDLSYKCGVASDIEYIYLVLVKEYSCELYFLPTKKVKNSALTSANYSELVNEVALFGIELNVDRQSLPFTFESEKELIARRNNREVK
jgi:hypothetical protein